VWRARIPGAVRIRALVFGVLLVSVVIVALRETLSRSPTAVERPGTAQSDNVATSDLIEEGRYLATVGNCISCHTRRGGSDFSGGLGFRTPLEVLYSTNSTPDVSTGIGRWSAADFIRAMRLGKAPNGRHLYPAFPYPSFSRTRTGKSNLAPQYCQRILSYTQAWC
jgi:hypothetical protein